MVKPMAEPQKSWMWAAAEDEFACLQVEEPKRVGCSDWSTVKEKDLRSLLGIDASRDLLEFRVNPRMSTSPDAGEWIFLTYVLNALFNVGPRMWWATDPPNEVVDDDHLPLSNLLWRRMVRHLLGWSEAECGRIHPELPFPDNTYRQIIGQACKEDPVFFTNGFVVIHNPNVLNERLRERPFVLWPRQEELLKTWRACLDNVGDLLPKKRSDLGVTTVFVSGTLHGWDFRDESFLWTTKDQEALDGKGADTVFDRLRGILHELPQWLQPPGWSWSKAEGYAPMFRLVKPKNMNPHGKNPYYQPKGAVIEGRAATREAGISQRRDGVIFDEFATYDQKEQGLAEYIWQATGPRVRCRCAPSTPRGQAAYHEKLFRGGTADYRHLEQRSVTPFTINWTDDPRRNGELDRNDAQFSFIVTPQAYANEYDRFAMLLQLRLLQRERGLDSRDYRDQLKRFRLLDRVSEQSERKRVWNEYVLKEIIGRFQAHSSSESITAELIVAEVLGEAIDSRLYLFPPAVLDMMPLEDGEAGDFPKIREDHRFARFEPMGGRVRVWRPPAADRHYLLTSDVGHGVGQDSSVASVWDVTERPVSQVAQFRDNRTPPGAFALYCWCLAYWYRCGGDDEVPAFWIPEVNIDSYVEKALCRLNFPRHRVYLKPGKAHPDDPMDISAYGYYSVGSGRQDLMVDLHEELVTSRSIEIRSSWTVAELRRILKVNEKGKHYPPDSGWTDDCVIDAALVVPGLRALNAAEFPELGAAFVPVGARMARRGLETREREQSYLEEEARQYETVGEDAMWAAR